MGLTSEMIAKIEELPIRLDEKIEIILEVEKAKPASSIAGHARNLLDYGFNIKMDGLGIYRVPREIPDSVAQVLKQLNLHSTDPEFSVHPYNSDSTGEKGLEEIYGIMYSYSPTNLNVLIRASQVENRKEMYEAQGKAFGIPKRNIEYFLGKRRIKPDTVPVKLSAEEERILEFANYVTERRDPLAVRESLSLGRKYASIIRKMAPNLYNKIMSG